MDESKREEEQNYQDYGYTTREKLTVLLHDNIRGLGAFINK